MTTPDRAFARALVRDLYFARGLARDRDLVLDLEIELARARDLATSIARNREVDSDVHARLAGVDAWGLARDLANRRNRRYCADDYNFAGLLDRAVDRVVGRKLHRAIAHADALAAALTQDGSHLGGRLASGDRPARVYGRAKELIRLAVLLLPAGERARYAEELAAELQDVASETGSRPAQIAYAARQFRSSLLMRLELARPQKRNAPL